MKYIIPYFFRKFGKLSQNLSSAAVVIGALRVMIEISKVQEFGNSELSPMDLYTGTHLEMGSLANSDDPNEMWHFIRVCFVCQNKNNHQRLKCILIRKIFICNYLIYSKTCVKWPLSKRPQIGFQDQLSLNAGQKYCRMLQGGILQYFRPALSYNLSLRSLFCLFLSGRFTLFYCIYK